MVDAKSQWSAHNGFVFQTKHSSTEDFFKNLKLYLKYITAYGQSGATDKHQFATLSIGRRTKDGHKEEILLTLLSTANFDDFAQQAVDARLAEETAPKAEKIRKLNNFLLKAIEKSKYFNLGKYV